MRGVEGVAMPVFGGGTREIDVDPVGDGAGAASSSSRPSWRAPVEAALRAAVPMSPRAIQQAPFRVLVGANMPAVLVEIGYLTNAGAGAAAGRRRRSRPRRAGAHRCHRAVLRDGTRNGVAGAGGNRRQPR